MSKSNTLKYSNMSHRKQIFLKIAKKDKTFLGKQNKKSIEKILHKATEAYNDLKKQLDKAKSDKNALDTFITTKEDELKKHKKDMLDCHDHLKHLGLSGASELKIDNDDVAYVFDGKLYHVNFDTGEKKPYSQYKKEKYPEKQDDTNDLDNVDPDGVDITL